MAADGKGENSAGGAMRDKALESLKSVLDPKTGRDVVSAGMVGDLSVEGGAARLVLEIDPARGQELAPLAAEAEQALLTLEGVKSASAILTAHSGAGQAKPAPAQPAAPKLGPAPKLKAPAGSGPEPSLKPLRPAPQKQGPIEGVSNIIAIGSGKGGVGKSTVSANLAVALAAEGRRVGLLDADVYGPSQPRMLGVSGRPASPDGQMILPLRNHGVTLMSIGLLTPDDKAVIWRGPMLMGALQQMLRQVAWGRLDALLVDLPPGTGDVQLTLSQKAEVTGAVIVSTPQDVALIDAKKAIDMFQRTETPILGMIENMSSFCCPNCGHETPLFGQGGAEAEAERIGAPFLGAIPLDIDIRLAGDGGAPIVAAKPDSPQSQAFRQIAKKLIEDGHA